MILMLCLLLVAGLAQERPAVEPLDCRKLLERAAPGIERLCLAEEAMRRAARAPGGSPERVELWRAAADAYARAVAILQAIEHRKHALEMLVQVNAPTHLRNPEGVERALRGLMELDPGTPQPALRLAKFQEERERLDAAEETLLFARQQKHRSARPDPRAGQVLRASRPGPDAKGRRWQTHPAAAAEPAGR